VGHSLRDPAVHAHVEDGVRVHREAVLVLELRAVVCGGPGPCLIPIDLHRVGQVAQVAEQVRDYFLAIIGVRDVLE